MESEPAGTGDPQPGARGHGKRAGSWQGQRQVYDCIHCHNPHQPALLPREPMAPPPVRAGLHRRQGQPKADESKWSGSQNRDPTE